MQQAPIGGANAKYAGLLHAVGSIRGEEGLRGFWRGNLAATGLWVSYSALQFGSFRVLAALWPRDVADTLGSATVSTVDGALAGMAATALTYPLDLFRTILASQGVPRRFPTMRSLATHVWASRGMRGLYSGLPSTLFQIAPYAGLSFGIYTALNDIVAEHRAASNGNNDVSQAKWALSFVGTGGVAGFASKLAVYPLDTVKKRMQMRQVPRHDSYGVIPRYTSSWACGVDVLRREGLAGLYKGMTPSLLKSVVGHSAMFVSYEVALLALQRAQSEWERLPIE